MLVIGISSCESSLERSLAAASNHCNRRVTLRLGVERQRHFVRGRRPLLVRSSDSEDGAVGDALREMVAVALSCDLAPLSLCLPKALVANARR